MSLLSWVPSQRLCLADVLPGGPAPRHPLGPAWASLLASPESPGPPRAPAPARIQGLQGRWPPPSSSTAELTRARVYLKEEKKKSGEESRSFVSKANSRPAVERLGKGAALLHHPISGPNHRRDGSRSWGPAGRAAIGGRGGGRVVVRGRGELPALPWATSPRAYLPARQGQPARGAAPSLAPALFPDPSNRSLNLPVPGAWLRTELVIIHPVPGLLGARVAPSPVPVVLQERASLLPCP